ncbi:MAG: MazG nucleotide pyrophosphohydrolase domain-containing protein [Thermoplasmatota archaeon]
MDLSEIQRRAEAKFGAQDRKSGLPFLAMVLLEEVGELCEAIRKGETASAGEEAGDVLFMALSIATVAGVDIEPIVRAKFLDGDPTSSWTDVP